MRLFLRYLSLLFLFTLIAWVKIPQRYDVTFPREPGPEFNDRVRNIFTQKINTDQPDIVLLGDSTLQTGVDPALLSERTGLKTSRFDVQGSASAYWYLALKNNIANAKHPPQILVIVFRDTILTAPGYRVHGGYFVQLDELAGRDEPLLLDRSYLQFMSPLEIWSERYFPVYGARGYVRQETDSMIRYALPSWLNCDKDCVNEDLYQVFTSADMEPGQLQNAVAVAESYLYTSSRLNFDSQIGGSYLPEMIRLARENRIRLILVRLKNRTLGDGSHSSASLQKYLNRLSEYLSVQQIPYLDYGADPRLKNEHFTDSLHLNAEGKKVFTEVLADGLNGLLK